ncbi:hypothetical protein AAF712_004666 [Marasmius tenuissimus]|uniref:Uncharacterized protein n=1 Tax=Marasmius tenuissimus TaxID=585030 RepID=A0ABR3A4M0_9AGAR
MPQHFKDTCNESSCLHLFAAWYLPTDNSFEKPQPRAKQWFGDNNVHHAAMLRLVLLIAPEVRECVNCPELPGRPHILKIVATNHAIRLERACQGRCSCAQTMFELTGEYFNCIASAMEIWRQERQRNSIISKNNWRTTAAMSYYERRCLNRGITTNRMMTSGRPPLRRRKVTTS